MKVLMFGWEFPPYKGGGLATACYDLTKGLAKHGISISFVMPHAGDDASAEFVKLIGTKDMSKKVKIKKIDSLMMPYTSAEQYNYYYNKIKTGGTKGGNIYGKDLYEEVERFAKIGGMIAAEEEHEVIHAHDWMTYKAGICAREVSGKPLVVHIHATEFDRTGDNPNTHISKIEYMGLNEADMIIANSNFTKDNVVRHYNVNPEKIKVVHWGIDHEKECYRVKQRSPFGADKIVLFLGRLTLQKGPDYFMEVANNVLKYEPNVKFVISGEGDMFPRLISRAAELGIADKVLFTGWLSGNDVNKAFQMADLYVMPSVSEPFGLVALESLRNGTPVIISKQSGVSEVLRNALRADFWDIYGMTNKIVSVLRHRPLHRELTDHGFREVMKFNIYDPARKCIDAYNEAISRGGRKW